MRWTSSNGKPTCCLMVSKENMAVMSDHACSASSLSMSGLKGVKVSREEKSKSDILILKQ